jgi:hypothetical protein
MTPVRFAQANVEMQAPAGQEESVHPLWCWRGEHANGMPCFISAWRPTPEELVKLNLGEPIFLSILSGALPPHALTVDNPLEQPTKEEEET